MGFGIRVFCIMEHLGLLLDCGGNEHWLLGYSLIENSRE